MANTLQSLITVVACIGIIYFIHNIRQPDSETTDEAAVKTAKIEDALLRSGDSSIDAIGESQDTATLIAAGDFDGAKKRLLELAGLATDDDNQLRLARILSELGEVTLAQGDLDAAEIYLAESLDVYEQRGEEVLAAGVHTQFGRMYLMQRERAREASYAYDKLLIARWRLNHDQFDLAEQALKQIVVTNLGLNRFGAAASAYQTLFSAYTKQQQFDKAESAGIEAVRLLASSGRRAQANTMLDRMQESGVSGSVYIEIKEEIAILTRQFDNDANAIAVARDQRQLYNQLLARGDFIQAWRFREKAEQTLSKVNSRARYRRQSDQLVELYRSNWSMKHARTSLQHARNVFLRNGMESQAQQAEDLQQRIF